MFGDIISSIDPEKEVEKLMFAFHISSASAIDEESLKKVEQVVEDILSKTQSSNTRRKKYLEEFKESTKAFRATQKPETTEEMRLRDYYFGNISANLSNLHKDLVDRG
jgi:hypothetical protein